MERRRVHPTLTEMRHWLPAIVWGVLGAATGRAQSAVGAIEGVVRDRAGPISEVWVGIRGTVLRTTTDTLGRYRIEGVSPGLVTLVALRRSSSHLPEWGSFGIARHGMP